MSKGNLLNDITIFDFIRRPAAIKGSLRCALEQNGWNGKNGAVRQLFNKNQQNDWRED
jgi:hypothetical protein